MQIIKEDPTLNALIDLFNEQSKKSQWDAAYGTSVAIAELKIGVVNRALAAADERVAPKKGRKKSEAPRY